MRPPTRVGDDERGGVAARDGVDRSVRKHCLRGVNSKPDPVMVIVELTVVVKAVTFEISGQLVTANVLGGNTTERTLLQQST